MTRNIVLGLVAVGLLFSGVSRATQLITEEEAKLPPPKGAVAADRRGILRGPKVEFVSPGDSVSSPMRLQLKFKSFGGAKIDPEFGQGDFSPLAECRSDAPGQAVCAG